MPDGIADAAGRCHTETWCEGNATAAKDCGNLFHIAVPGTSSCDQDAIRQDCSDSVIALYRIDRGTYHRQAGWCTLDRMPGWEALEPFILEYRRGGREAFLRAHPHPVLVFKHSKDRDPCRDHTSTETLTGSRIELAKSLSEDEMRRIAGAEGFRILEVKAAGESVIVDGITVGRSKSCDLLVSHRTVSKQHARLKLIGDGRVSVQDVGSRNGTRLNGSRLQPDWEATLETGDNITFGNVTATFRSPEAFCSLMALILEG